MERRPFRRARGSRGQATVEFALALPIALLLLLVVFEFSRHYYTRMNVRNAVAEAARFAATGQTLLNEESGEAMSRAESIVSVMVARASGLNLDVDNINIDPVDGGGPDDIVSINATYRFDFIGVPIISKVTPPFVEFTVATTFKNEPVF